MTRRHGQNDDRFGWSLARRAGLGWLVAACGLALPAALPGEAAAQDAASEQNDEPLPDAASLFDRHWEAAGGWERASAVTGRTVRGTIETPSGDLMSLTLWQKAPDLWRLRVTVPIGPDQEQGWNGEAAWVSVEDQGTAWLPPLRAIDVRDNAEFYGEANRAARYESVETVGRRALPGGGEAHVVGAVARSGRNSLLFFDLESGLHVGTRTTLIVENRQAVMDVIYDDFKEVEGLLVPHRIEQRVQNGSGPTILTFREVRMSVDDAVSFEPPEDIGEPPVVPRTIAEALGNTDAEGDGPPE